MTSLEEDLDFVWQAIKFIAAAALVLSGILAVLSVVGLPLLVVVVPEVFAVTDPLPRNWGPVDLLGRGSVLTGLTLLAGAAVVNLELAALVHALRAGGKQGFKDALGEVAGVNMLCGIVVLPILALNDLRLFHAVGLALGYGLRYFVDPLIVFAWLVAGGAWVRDREYPTLLTHYAGAAIIVGSALGIYYGARVAGDVLQYLFAPIGA